MVVFKSPEQRYRDSRDSITSSTFLAERFGVLSSAKFAISITLCVRNKLAKKNVG